MEQRPEEVAERLHDVVVEFGLRRVQAVTDTHVIEVEEPSIWSRETGLQTTVRPIDI